MIKHRSYKKVFAIISAINKAGGSVNHRQLVSDFTEKRTESLADLSDEEFSLFESNLVSMAPGQDKKKDYSSDPLDTTRKAIISQFKSIGGDAADAKEWCEKYGVNGVKKPFNDYTGQELYVLLQNAKKVKQHRILQINKKLDGIQQAK